MKDFWNSRFALKSYVYGKKPNKFVKETLDKLNLKGKVLFPADGEGRNSVYAATKGLEVFAFDISIEGQKKALALAKEQNVSIIYEIINLDDLDLEKESFDAIVLVFAHFPPQLRQKYHRKLTELLVPGGILILQGFNKENFRLRQRSPLAGGPGNIDMLFSIEELKDDFEELDFVEIKKETIILREGDFHKAESSVIHLIAKKNKNVKRDN